MFEGLQARLIVGWAARLAFHSRKPLFLKILARGVPSSVQPTNEVQILTVVRWWISCLLWHSEITFGIPSGDPQIFYWGPRQEPLLIL